MKIQKIIVSLIIMLILCNFAYAEGGSMLIEQRATYSLSSEWIYEGVVSDEEGNFPQQKYTYGKNLDEFVLYGNRNIYEEMKARVPFISKDTFQSTFSNQDLASIIANASGGETYEVDYGNNHFYETITTQQANKNGQIITVNCVIDMFFEEEYIHSFSYCYKDVQSGLPEYKAMLASFKLGAPEKPKMSKRDMLLQQEREEEARKLAEQKAQKTNSQPSATVAPTAIPVPTETAAPTVTPVPTETPAHTEEPKQEVQNVEPSAEIVEVKETKSGDILGDAEKKDEVKDEEVTSGDEEANVSGESELTVVEPTYTPIPTEAPTTPEPVREVRKAVEKRSLIKIILSNPNIQKLIVFVIIIDVTFTVIIKIRKKKKKQKANENKQETNEKTPENTSDNTSTDDKK